MKETKVDKMEQVQADGKDGTRGITGKELAKKGRRKKANNGKRDRTMSLHDIEELDDDFGARSDHDLSLARLLGIVDALERVAQHTGANHGDGKFVGRGKLKQNPEWEDSQATTLGENVGN